MSDSKYKTSKFLAEFLLFFLVTFIVLVFYYIYQVTALSENSRNTLAKIACTASQKQFVIYTSGRTECAKTFYTTDGGKPCTASSQCKYYCVGKDKNNGICSQLNINYDCLQAEYKTAYNPDLAGQSIETVRENKIEICQPRGY